jgi:hypothetical protein
MRIIGEEGGGKQVAALYKQSVVSNLRHGQGWSQEEMASFLSVGITPPTFDNALLIKLQNCALRNFSSKNSFSDSDCNVARKMIKRSSLPPHPPTGRLNH